MKRPARIQLVWKWFGLSALFAVPAFGMLGAASVHALAASPIPIHLTQAIAQVPTVSFWAGVLPQARIIDGVPMSAAIAAPFLIAMFWALTQWQGHRAMLADEDKARAMQDL